MLSNHQIAALAPLSWYADIGITSSSTEMPTPTRAIANLMEVRGARSASFVHSAAKIGAKMMMNNGFTDCSHDAGISHEPMLRSVTFFANRFNVDPDCSNTIQNAAPAMNTHTNARTCARSRSV